MPIIKRDFETRSAVNLKKVGARRYAADPTTSVLCICYAVDDGPIESFVPEDGKPVPDVFIEAAHNPDWSVAAHNDPFESAIEEYVLGPRFNWPWVPIERHICTMATARYHGLPGELGKGAALLDLPIQKDREGARLMLQLCRPRKPRRGEDPTQLYWPEITPEKLARLIMYCKNDVAAEREIFCRLPPVPDEEHRLWRLDRKINVRGFRGDLEFATAACKLADAEKAHNNSEIATLTGGAVTGFTKLNDIREFVNARGHNMTALDKRAVTAVLAHDPDDTVRTVLELRQASSNTAVAKYAAVLASAFPDQPSTGC
jgi:DNA polymerase